MKTSSRTALAVLGFIVAVVIVRAITPALQGYVFGFLAGARSENISEIEVELDALRAMQADYGALLDDYYAALDVASDATSTSVARVISHPVQSPRDTLMVGTHVGDVGDIVYADSNKRIALGTITEARSGVARVTLFSEVDIETPAKVGFGEIPVTLIGFGTGEMRFEVARDVSLAVGDGVYLSDTITRIGSVAVVDVSESDPVQVGRLHLYENITTLDYVYIEA